MGFSSFVDNNAFKFDSFNLIPQPLKDTFNPVLQPLQSFSDQVTQPIKDVVKPFTGVIDGALDFAGDVTDGLKSFMSGDWFIYILIGGGIILAIMLLK